MSPVRSAPETVISPPIPGGVMCVLPTPFRDDGRVDCESLQRLTNEVIVQGATGIVCFGLASEGYKLTDGERRQILKAVVEAAEGRVPVISGSEDNSAHSAAARTDWCIEYGASAVMTMPPSFVKPTPQELFTYYSEVARAASGAPVIIQDAPNWTGVNVPVRLIVELRELSPNILAVKVENPPHYEKISTLRSHDFVCLGGYGALHILEDVDAGISGVMCGAGTIPEMVELWSALESDSALAWRLFERLLPLLSFQMSSLDVFIACQKELLAQAGIIYSSAYRQPGQPLTDHQRQWLAMLNKRREKSSQ